MRLHIMTTAAILFVLRIGRIAMQQQGTPLSPCPKLFQYRFDGNEWFGVLSVRSPDFVDALHLKVTLSLRGKPATNYLGEIALLTRGQFRSDAPVLYKVKFPKSPMPPRLLQIMANNQVVCLGGADQSIFVTQIILEHTRKFAFLPDNADDDGGMMTPLHGLAHMSLTPDFGGGHSELAASDALSAADGSSSDSAMGGGSGGMLIKESSGFLSPADVMPHSGFGTKHFPLSAFEKNPPHGYHQENCGKIDERIRFEVFRSMPNVPVQRTEPPSRVTAATDSTAGGQPIGRRRKHQPPPGMMRRGRVAGNVGANGNSPLVTSSDVMGSGGGVGGSASSVSPPNELPSVTRGAWPWLAAIYVNNSTSLAYQCGGTLVSARVVISSAHCFHMYQQRYTANEVLVFLGRHNLNNWNEESSLAAPVDDIYIHPDYDSHLNTYDADIAVVLLKHATRANTFIRPACMWSGSTKAQYMEGELGIVVSWGLANLNASAGGGSGNAVPRIVTAPIVSSETCFSTNAQYHSLSSNRTFCAGTVTTTAATRTAQSATAPASSGNELCTGDSGAGLMLYKNNRWMLRGTVSASLPRTDSGQSGVHATSRCNANQYVIYTDVAKFLDWIFAFII